MTPEAEHPKHLHPYVPLEDPGEEASQAESIAEFEGKVIPFPNVIQGPWTRPDIAA